MQSASNHYTQIEALSKRPDYKHSYDEVYALLWSNHYKEERHEQVLERVERLGNVARKENKRQLKAGVNCTAAIVGLVPYSSVIKGKKGNGHLEDVKLELTHRGCPIGLLELFVKNK
eukprot:5221358-Ditylum_brightwellii.AAC.1